MAIKAQTEQSVFGNQPLEYQRGGGPTADAFGAGVGRSLEGLGKAFAFAADTAENIAVLQARTNVDDVINTQYSPAMRALNKQYYSLQGKDAVQAQAGIANQMEEQRAALAGNFHTQLERNMFDQMSRRSLQNEFDGMQRYAEQQNRAYVDTTFQSTLKNYEQQAADKFNSEHDFGLSLGSGQAAIEQYARDTGKPSEWVRAKSDEFLSSAATNRVQTWMLRDPIAADKWYRENKEMINAQARPVLEHQLKSAVMPVRAAGIVSQVMTPQDQYEVQTSLQLGGTEAVNETSRAVNAPRTADSLFQGVLKAENSKTHDISPKFAYGRAQVLESTGLAMAKKLGVPFDLNKFRDSDDYNMMLGKAYLDEQLQTFGGNATLAFAAYNAGPARVTEWISKFGDPRTGAISDADWAAKIPFKETRDYVPRALAATGGAQAVTQTSSAGTIPVSLGVDGTPTKKRDTQAMVGQWIADAEKRAQEEYPNDPAFRDLVVQQVKGKVATIIQIQQGIQKQAHGVLIQASMGMNGAPPTTPAELFQIPNARQAFSMLDPVDQHGILGLLHQNALQATGQTVRSNPAIVQDTFNRIHADEGDPRKIRDIEQLAPLFAPDASGKVQLNRSDYDWMKSEIKERSNPFTKDVNETRRAALSMMKAGIMGRMIADTQPEKIEEAAYAFNLDLDRKIKDYQEKGKDPRLLITRGTPDYVLNPASVNSFLQSPSQALGTAAAQVRSAESAPASAPAATGYDIGKVYHFKQGDMSYKGGDPKNPDNWTPVKK